MKLPAMPRLARATEPPLGLDLDTEVDVDVDAEIDFEVDLDVETAPDPFEVVLDAADPNVGAPMPTTSHKVRRERKRSRPRSKTIALKRMTRAEMLAGARAYPPVDDIERPKTRAECRGEQRPCPWVACKHHLYLDINPETGSIKINFPDLEPWELRETCALDVAERGGITLDEVGEVTNLTRERIRQLEVRGLLKLRTVSRGLR